MNRLHSQLMINLRSLHVCNSLWAKDIPTLELTHNFKFGTRRSTRVEEHNGKDRHADGGNRKNFDRRPIKLPTGDRGRRRDFHRYSEERATQKKPTEISTFAKQHEDLNMNILFGLHPVLMALRAKKRKLKKLFVKKGQSDRLREVISAAQRENVPVQESTLTNLERLTCGRVHQGVCLRVTDLPVPEMKSPIGTGETKRTPLWLLLDGIFDPMNLGAILRTAYFMGVDGILAPKEGTCPLSPVVSKASSGVMEVISYFHLDNVERFVEIQRQHDWDIVGTVISSDSRPLPNALDIEDLELTKPTIVVIGNEGSGIDVNVQKHCTVNVTVPPGFQSAGEVSSLNVSVATGILLHSIRRKLEKLNSATS